MLSRLILAAQVSLDNLLIRVLASSLQPEASLAPIAVGSGRNHSLHGDPLTDGFGILWNTPKHRTTIERRNAKKFAGKEWGKCRMLQPNRRLRVDHVTGETFELGRLPLKSYEAVMAETKLIQEKMKEAFGIDAKDKEVRVLYKDDDAHSFGSTDKIKVVEMEKERPIFFSKNLTQRTAKSKEVDDTTTTVRPSELA